MAISNIKEFKEKEELFLKKAKEIDEIKDAVKNLELRIGRNDRNSQNILEELFNKEKVELQKIERDNSRQEQRLNDERNFFEQLKKKGLKAVEQMAKERQIGFPWLAKAYDEFFSLQEKELVNFLTTKKHPAASSAEVIKEQSHLRRQAEKEKKIAQYLVEYYENIAPFLIDLKEEVDIATEQERELLKEYSEEELEDTATQFLSKEEYRKLPSVQRNQMALDRFWKRPKSK